MKRKSFALTLAAAATLAIASAVQAGPPSSAFSGSWMGFGGNTTEYLVVKGGNNARIDFQEDYGSACWDARASDLWFSGTLSGDVSGATMTGVFKSAKCGHVSLSWMRGQTMVWALDTKGTSDPSDDTLFDGTVTWSRVP